MRKKHILLLLVAAVLLLAGCNQATNKGFYLYKSSPIGFRIEYPQSWTKQVDLDKKIAAFVTPQEGIGDRYRDNISITQESLGEQEFSEFFAAHYAALPGQFAGFTAESKEEVLVDNREAYKIVFSSSRTVKDDKGKESTAKLRVMQYVVKVEEKAYFITYIGEPEAYDYFMPFVNVMMETVSFKV